MASRFVFIVLNVLSFCCHLKAEEIQFKFGVKTTSNVDCTNPNNITVTLMWLDRMFQCPIEPKQFNKEYICNTSTDSHIECDATLIDPQYAIQIFQPDISSYQNSQCIEQVIIQTINLTWTNDTDQFIMNVTQNLWTGFTGSNFLIHLNKTLSNITNPNIQTINNKNAPICYPFVNVTITSCGIWNYGSTSNSLQMKLVGSNGATEFFFVNKLSQLPSNEINESLSFYIDDIANALDVGDLYSVYMSVDDLWGYCVKGLTVKISNNVYTFSAKSYFGSGIILSNECRYSYQYLSDNYPLISCIPGILHLNAYSLRGIYSLHMHSCITEHSGMSITNMKDNLYAVIMGKQINDLSYSTTEISFLDHFYPKTVNLQQLGHLTAGNFLLSNSPGYSVYSNVNGFLIGIKLESVDYETYQFMDSELVNVTINTVAVNIFNYKIVENGRYLIQFFEVSSRTNITTLSTQIDVYSQSLNFKVNLYLIFEEYSDSYQLPFKVWKSSEHLTWSEARDKCIKNNGTDLVSIHSDVEDFLITGFMGNDGDAWIGLFDYTLEKQNNWRWMDGSIVDYVNWAPVQPDNAAGDEDCAIKYEGTWNDVSCNLFSSLFICSTPQWNTNTDRIFEINVNEYMDDVTLISLGNNNIYDNICIDFVSINYESAVYISDNWIGGNSGIFQSNAIFKYPVCATTVVSTRVDYDNSETIANYIAGDTDISGLECINNGRQTSSTCSISQTFQFTTTTSFGITNSDSSTKQYSWGTASAVTLGQSETESSTIGKSSTSSQSDTSSQSNTNSLSASNSHSHTTSDSFSVGFSESLSITTNELFSTQTVNVGSHQDYTHSSSDTSSSSMTRGQSHTDGHSHTTGYSETASESNTNSKTNSKSNTNSDNEENTDSSTSTSGKSSTYSTTETTSVECSASINVPPSHSIEYSLSFNSINITLNTFTSLKLTLCSAFLNPNGLNDESNYIYISNIPGIIKKKEAKSCTVDFEPAKYIRNSMTCYEEQQLAIFSSSTYLPTCRTGNSSLYDGCQCDKGNLKTLAVCWCVDSTGNKINSKAIQVDADQTYEDVCVNQLNCHNTIIKYTVKDTFNSVVHNSAVQTQSILAFVIIFSLIFCSFCIVYVYNSYNTSKIFSNQKSVSNQYQKL